MNDREFWLAVRTALLSIVDAIERRFGIKPLTSLLRKEVKRP
jgi:hypothetical protein